jgi:hypothetical protein
MQTINYIGFGNLVCQCDYVTGNINGNEVLILKQTNGSKTTITNVVENIMSGLLAGPLSNVDATKLRVFEFYSPSLRPSVVWQEVNFAGAARRSPRRSIIQQVIEYFKL